MAASDALGELVTGTLTEAGLEVVHVSERAWATSLSGEHKRTIPVLLELADRSLKITSPFVVAPDEGHAEVYRILLERNRHAAPVHFAIDEHGEVVLTGRLARELLDDRSLDELLGAVLTMADEAFDIVLRIGFATYIEAEQRWRARVGLPPNPVSGQERG